MHSYEGKHGRLPPAVVYSDEGKALLSWRVLLLPYIEQHELFNQFKLDQPWDSPNNIRLLERMPPTFAPPPGKASRVPPHHTVIHVIVGKGTAFEEGPKGLQLDKDFPDGTHQTILMIEAGDPAPWTKPDNLTFDPTQPLPEWKCILKKGFRVCMGDGVVRYIPKEISESTLRAAITRNGKDELGRDWP